MRNTFTIEADIKRRASTGEIVVVQNDSIRFIVAVFDNGNPFDLSSVETVSLANTLSTKQTVVTPGTIVGSNTIQFDLGTNETQSTGGVNATVQLYDSEGRVSTISFSYKVVKDPTGDDYVPSETEQTLIEVVLNDGPLVIQDAQTKADYAQTQGDYAKTQGDYAKQVADENKTNFLAAVATVADRDTTYPTPSHGDTVRVTSEAKTYRYVNGTGWVVTDEYNPTAIDEVNAQLADNANEIGILNKKTDKEFSILNNFYTGGFSLVLAGIDSLTNGAGGTKYLDYFAPRFRGEFGDGGPGYVPIDYGFSVEEGFSFGKSGGLSYIENATPGQYPAKYSFDIKGVYCDAGVNEYFTLKISRKWTHGKLFYLKQPGGGTFKVGYAPESTDTHDTVDTNHTDYELGVYNFTDNTPARDGHIKCSSINGKVVIFGGLFWNDEGVAISRIGKGGRKFADIAAIDPQFLTSWITELSPKMFIFNGGMNDRTTMTAEDYRAALDSYSLPFINSGCHIILKRPNAIDGDNTRLDEYEVELKDFARTHKTDYFSNLSVLGLTYNEANSKGYMLDTIHPNEIGNRKIANGLLNHFSIPILGINKTEFNGGGGIATKIHKTELTPKQVRVTYGNSEVIYRLGLANGYPNGMLTLDITGSRVGTDHIVKKRTMAAIKNGTTINNVTVFNGKTDTVIYQYYAGGQPDVDFTVTLSIVNGLLEVSLSPNTGTYDMDFYIEGNVVLTYLYNTGQSVFEN